MKVIKRVATVKNVKRNKDRLCTICMILSPNPTEIKDMTDLLRI